LSGALSTAVRYGYIRQSPLISVRKPQEHPTEVQTFSEAELGAIESEIAQLPTDQQIRWLLAFQYGLRQGECLALRCTDFENREVIVQRTVRNIPGKGLAITEPKSRNAKRTIPGDDHLWNLAESISDREVYVYGQKEVPVDSSVDRRRFKVLIRKAGARELPMHAARHTVATIFIKQNVNPRVVQMILGHSSPAYTLSTYVHPGATEIRELIQNHRKKGVKR
jgi:integrase